MSNRYSNTQKIVNNSSKYKDYFKSRNLKNVTQYSTFSFGLLQTIQDSGIPYTFHTVQPFEKLFMISQRYYNSPEYGWLICYLNQIPNELEIYDGMALRIYYPLDNILRLLNERRP
jgi:hypothetical protein